MVWKLDHGWNGGMKVEGQLDIAINQKSENERSNNGKA